MIYKHLNNLTCGQEIKPCWSVAQVSLMCPFSPTGVEKCLGLSGSIFLAVLYTA